MKKLNQKIRVRFAPSPTGPLHIGGARTALFNYLFAKKQKGVFILRIEDTDPQRSKKEFENDIKEGLSWLGLFWDKEYRQSERFEIYKKYLKKLIQEKKAYYCFCTPEELKAMRDYQISQGFAPKYPGKCRGLTKKEVAKKLAQGLSAVIRFKTPEKKIKFKDLIRKEVEFDGKLLGDFPLAKRTQTEFFPLYNFAVVVDDFEMKITHVIRGEDHLPNTPKQIFLQKALGFFHPKYAHLPLILGPDKSKLSKRHGATSLNEYRKMGYLPQAMINFLALLGWHPQKEREIFNLSSLIEEFSLERVQKSGAIFNLKKLDYLNGFYIRQKSKAKLTELCLPYLIEAKFLEPVLKTEKYPPALGGESLIQSYLICETKESISFEFLEKIVALFQERLKKLSEITNLADFFFKKNLQYPKELLRWKKMEDLEVKEALERAFKILEKIQPREWEKEKLEKILLKEAESFQDRGKLLWPLRVALTGKKASPPPFDILEVLGKQKSLKRIQEALEKF